MTEQETAKIVYVLRATYPSQYSRFNASDYNNMIQAWSAVMEDYSYRQVSDGLKIFIASDTKGFPPSPGQIIDCILKAEHPATADMTEAEAWTLVYKTMTSMQWNHVEEAYNSLPNACKRAVGSVGRFREMAMEEDAAAQLSDRARFQDNYRVAVRQERDEAKIPQRVRLAMAERLKMINGAQERNETDNQNTAGPAAIPGRADEDHKDL